MTTSGKQRHSKLDIWIRTKLSLTKNGWQAHKVRFIASDKGLSLKNIFCNQQKNNREDDMKEENNIEPNSKQPFRGVTSRRGLFSLWLFLFIAFSLAPVEVRCRGWLNA
ncbi:hypothetical protein EGW08_022238, partial [Elysia chlorotica]